MRAWFHLVARQRSSELFMLNVLLIGMLLLNLPFSYLVKTFPREKFISISYRFFSANILLFALALYSATPEQTIWVGRIFFIWTSIFNLFVVSIFWQMIVDIFTSEQGKYLFIDALQSTILAPRGLAYFTDASALTPA